MRWWDETMQHREERVATDGQIGTFAASIVAGVLLYMIVATACRWWWFL